MADHNKPTLSSTYANLVAEYDGRLKDMAAAFDPAYASVTNIPANAVRWSSAAKKWQYWNGTAWVDLASEYAISISGTAQKLKTARTFQISGGATAAAVNFDGSGNVNLNVTVLDGSKLNNLTASPTDTTSGHLLKVGDGGFLGVSVPLPAPGTDLATLAYASGVTYTLTGTIANSPLSGSAGILEVANRQFPGASGITLTATYTSSSQLRVFKCQVVATAASGLYTPSGPLTWFELYHSGNTGTAALANITTSATDTTPGRVLKVGDFGVGLSGAGQIIIDNVDRIDVPTGLYRVLNTTTGTLPANSGTHYGTLIVEAYSLISGTESFCQTFTRAFSSPQRWFRYYAFNLISGSPGWSPWVELYHSGNLGSDLQWLGTPVGGYITPISPPPTNDSRFRYIYCDAGQATTGKYNDGVLINETVIGAAPLVEATAVVNLPASPFHGQTVHLINTEGRYVGAGVGEAFEDDAIQNITGTLNSAPVLTGSTASGALTKTIITAGSYLTAGGGGLAQLKFDASDSARTSDHTQPRTHRLLHYRRIL